MAHEHTHDPKTYYVEQLCTIAICGALGGVAVSMYLTKRLWFIAPKIQIWILIGGIALLVLVVARAFALWVQAGRLSAEGHNHHDHDHDHDHDHGHDHEHCDGHGETCDHDHDHAHDHTHDHDHAHGHDHDHGHSHGGGDGHEHSWAPWRYVILLMPVVLFSLGLPDIDSKQASANDLSDMSGLKDAVATGKGDFLGEVDFRQLSAAPYTKQSRSLYEGKRVILKGEYLPGNDRMFTLVRYKINCCSADRVGLPAAIMLDHSSTEKKLPHGLERKWLTVEGQVQFQQRPDQPDTWVTVLVLKPDAEHPLIDPEGKNDKALIKVVKADANYYLY
jgi:hypothetical protein